ncbi:MAG: sulfotransferase family 2 domain-containing protein [Pseudomonadota bacterium]
MIICHSRKFIFIKTMKTAGTSLEVALSGLCSDNDILSPFGYMPDERLRLSKTGRKAQNYRYGFKEWRKLRNKQKLLALLTDYDRSRFKEHMSAAHVRREVGEEIWNSYYKFTVVRNPYDRFVSRYFFDMNEMKAGPLPHRLGDMTFGVDSPDTFIRYNAERLNENWKIYSDGDESLMDKAVRFEAMEEDLGEVSERIGLSDNLYDTMRSIHTKTGTRPAAKSHVKDVLSLNDRLAVYLLCRREFELYGYEPGEDVEACLQQKPRENESGSAGGAEILAWASAGE